MVAVVGLRSGCLRAMGQRMPCPPWAKQVSDDDLLEQYDAELAIRRSLWKNEKLLPPLGERMPIRNAFEGLLQICMVYTGFFVPLWACFQLPYHPAQLAVDYIIDMCFWMDIVLTSRTAFYDLDHELVMSRKSIQGAYMRKRLHLDVLANFPFELFALAAGHSITGPVFAGWKLFRMLRFFRLRKLHPPVLVELNSSAARRLVHFFPLVTHWVACIWFYIGISGPSDDENPPALIVERPDWMGGSSWLVRPNIGGLRLGRETSVQAYVSSLYWASSTLMKTAWIAPSTVVEKFYACCIVLMGAIMFAVFLGQVYKIIDRLDEGTAQRREKMAMFRLFCRHNRLSSSLSLKVISYAMAEWNVTRGVSTTETLKQLSPTLSGQLLYEMRKDVIHVCPLTSGTSLACAKKLLTRSTVQVCLKNENVVGFDELAREVFILMKGSLQISLPNGRKGSKALSPPPESGANRFSKKNLMQFRMLEKQGAMTGMWRPHDNGVRYPFEVQAREFTTMLNIGRQALLEVMSIFDEDRPRIESILEHEFELVQQALRIGGRNSSRWTRSVRDSGHQCQRDSSRDSSSGKEEDAKGADEALAEQEAAAEQARRKAELLEVNIKLDSVGCGLAKTLMIMSKMKESARTLPLMFAKLGHSVSIDEANSMCAPASPTREEHGVVKRGSCANMSSVEARRTQRLNDNQRAASRPAADSGEKREITACMRKSASDGASAAAIVL